ncbi:MAG: T9SS type A sorting domain-containing protein [Bacteroidia bacterium]
MKHFTIFKKSLFAILTSAVFYTANAQTARFQLIHNAADPSLDTVDVYVNGVVSTVSFRQATTIKTTASGAVKININRRNSIDSSDMVLKRFTQTLAANSNSVIMVTGVDSTVNFSANPNSINTGISLVTKTIAAWAAGAGKVQVNVFHGVTDAPGVDLIAKPTVSTGILPTNLRFAQANASTSTLFFNNAPTYLEIRLSGTRSVIKAYSANLTSLNQRMITVFASGFVNPTDNQNGTNFGMFAVDTNGIVMELTEATRLQFIHNAADVALQSVDIYLNNNKIAPALNFRAATPFLTVNAGNTEVRVSTANQTDTLFFIPSINLASGKSYLAMAMGLKDTAGFAVNPDNVNMFLNITGFDSMPESSLLAGSFQYLVANGNTDAPALSFNKVPSQTSVISDLKYGDFSALRTDNTGYIFNISNGSKTEFNGAYSLNAAAYLNQSGVVFTSGFYRAAGNPINAATFKVMMALSNGTVVELPRLQNKLQFIHNSLDSTIRTLDVYANGIKIVNDLGFRNATGIANGTDAYVPVRINITKGNAVDTSNALWSISMLPDSNFNIAIAHGFTGAAYRANPEGISTAFGVKMVTPGKILSTFTSPTNEVIFFNGCVNLGKVNIQAEQEALFVAKNTSYASLYKYSPAKGNAGATYFVNDGVTGKGLLSAKINFVGRSGLAGVMFASGIYLKTGVTRKDTSIKVTADSTYKYTIITYENKVDYDLFQKDSSLNLSFYIAWSNGKVDSFEKANSRTDVKEIIENNGFVMYPNPANENVSIVLNANQKSEGNVNLFDIKGAFIKSIKTKLDAGINNIELSLSDLPKGMYFVQINSNEGSLTKKLIIE